MKKSIRFIINPISGIGKKKILPGLIQKHLDHEAFSYDIVYTERREHARTLGKQAVEEGIDIVCVAGGDGSVNEAGTALINTNTALAILPTGSGNGIARHLGMSLKLKKVIKRINEYQLESIDTIILNNRKAIGVSGFGFDALIAKRFDEYHARGFWSYFKLVLKEFSKYQGISVVLNDKTEYSNLLFCTIANTSQFGNGFYISPETDIKDGEFEIVFVQLPPILGFVGLLISSIRGTVHKSKYVTMVKTNEAKLKVKQSVAHIDGEPIDFKDLSIKLNCNPASLSVVV